MDEQLQILGKVESPKALDDLDDRIMHALAGRRRDVFVMKRMMAAAAFLSLAGGILAGGGLSRSAEAASPLSPFMPANALAPSTLLASR